MIDNLSAQLRTVVDHSLVVEPEDVGRGLRGLPQVAVQLELGAHLDELEPCLLLLHHAGDQLRFLCSFIFHLYFSKCI